MKRVLILLCCVGALTAFFAGYRWLSTPGFSTLGDIRRLTGVKLPTNMATLSEFDNGETICGGKYRLEPRDINSFLADYPFQQLDEDHPRLSLYNKFDKDNPIPLAGSTSLVYFTGCNSSDSWLFTLNKKTGELWIEVQYPDWGGSAPGCAL